MMIPELPVIPREIPKWFARRAWAAGLDRRQWEWAWERGLRHPVVGPSEMLDLAIRTRRALGYR